MNNFSTSKIPFSAYAVAIARLFERIGYFGFRAIVVLHLTFESDNFSRELAIEYYGWIAFGLGLGQFFGGLIGDLINNNRLTAFAGGLICAAGFSLLLFNYSYIQTMIGIGCFIVGSSLFSVNIFTIFTRSFHSSNHLLEKGYSFYILAINLGGFFGAIIIAYLYEVYSPTHAFLVLIGLYILAIIPLHLSKVLVQTKKTLFNTPFKSKTYNWVIPVFTAAIAGLTWAILSFSNNGLSINFTDYFKYRIFGVKMYYLLEAVVSLFTCISLFLFWRGRKLNSAHLFLAGSILLLVGYTISFSSSAGIFTIDKMRVGLGAVLRNIGETFIFISYICIIARYANPKYFATIVGFCFMFETLVSQRFFALLVRVRLNFLSENSLPDWIIPICTSALTVTLSYILYRQLNKFPPILQTVNENEFSDSMEILD